MDSHKEKKKILKKKNLEIDIEENLNIDKELNNKTSSKALHVLFENHVNTDSNLNKNNAFKIGGTINPSILHKQNIFASKKSYTKKDLRKTMNGFFNKQKRASINNFRDTFCSSFNSKNKKNLILSRSLKNININKINQNKHERKKSFVEYEDLYFEDDMFIPESSSFPNEHEEDFLLKLQFIEDNNYDEDIFEYSIRNNSFSYKIKNGDNNHFGIFDNDILNNEKLFDFSLNLFKNDNIFIDEKETVGRNILYTEAQRNSWNIGRTSKTENDSNELTISYISLDLLIKKIATENLRNNYSDIYTCFIQQYKYFLPINNIINKIISAFHYYNYEQKYISELIIFLKEIILQGIEILKNDKDLFEQIKKLHSHLEKYNFNDQKTKDYLDDINYFLNNKTDEIINKRNKNNNNININNYNSIKNDLAESKTFFRKSSRSFFFKNKSSKNNIEDKEIKEIKERGKRKYNYFYIFNYNKEEIAAYLTLESYQLISNIKRSEIFNKNFIRKNKEKVAPNVMKLIERYDKLILFIIEDICSYDHKADRVEIIEKWLRIGLVCMEFKNFNDLIMINSLFCNYLLKKMKLTWQKVSKKSLNYIDKMNKFCSGTQCYMKIRKEIFKCKGRAYVPYLGILLKEIMAAEEMKYFTNNNINIQKLVKINKIITRFFEFTKHKYSFDKPNQLEILSNTNPKEEEQIELIIKQIEPTLTIHANKGDKKRITKSDESFYKNKK